MIGVIISEEEYRDYISLKSKNTALKKRSIGRHNKYCPVCGYVVDNAVPPQNYCDRCGQRLVR